MLKKIFKILKKKDINKFKKIIILNFLSFFFEFFSILSLPVFAVSLINVNFLKIKLAEFNSFFELKNYENIFLIKIFGVAVVLLFLLKNLYLLFLIRHQANFFKKIKIDLSNDIFSKYLYLSYENFIAETSATFVKNLTYETQSVYGYLNNLMLLFREFLSIFVVFILMFLYNYKITLILCVTLLSLTICYQLIIKPLIKGSAKKNQILSSNIIKILSETFGSIKEIKVTMKENEIIKLFKKNIVEFEGNLKKFYFFEKLPKIFLELFIIIFLIIIAFYLYNNNTTLDFLSNLAFFVILSFRFLPAFNSINTGLTYLKIFGPSVNLIYEKKHKFETFSKIDSNDMIDQNFSFNQISFENVCYKYPGNSKNILENLNFKINKGEKIGISGPTGVGKSTLIYLLMGLVKPSNGKISIDGVDIHNKLNNLKNIISYVPQFPFFYNGTIKQNIAYSFDNEKDLKDENFFFELIDFTLLNHKVNKTSGGLGYNVGDSANKFSGGEKQRLALARSLYKEFEILVMDEFTSALDADTEKKILSNLMKKYSKKTMIIISHKKTTLESCSKIINLKKEYEN